MNFQAGIPGCQLTLALEPESAALYCQLGVSRSGLMPVQKGAKFLLLDCGGEYLLLLSGDYKEIIYYILHKYISE